MSEPNLKQITDKLNSMFQGDTRKIVFWYDANGEFAEDIDTMELENAKILHLEKDNQFYTKHFLECEDVTTHYLVYAPFPKPDIRENHLADTIKYSVEFFADRASLIVLDLDCDEILKEVFQEYNKFFGSKERRQKFYDLAFNLKTKTDIEICIMSVLCKLKASNFDEVLRIVLIDDGFDNNKYLGEFEKYGVLNAFWKQADKNFGYSDTQPTLEKFIMSMFITCLSRTIRSEIPQQWKPFICNKSSNNMMVYLENLMNNSRCRERFDKISDTIYNTLNAEKIIRKMPVEDIEDCELFAGIDTIILDWLIDRLENEDTGANLFGNTIPQICENRRKKHFGNNVSSEYYIIENAWYLLLHSLYEPISDINNVIKKYKDELFEIDRKYRHFYYHYDKVDNNIKFEKLRQLIENVYANDYLNKICPNWNSGLIAANGKTNITKQIDFFDNYIGHAKERTVIIISDALRYEVGYDLYKKILSDEKYNITIEPMQSVIPSYTQLGMAALLPHKVLELTDDYKVLIDDNICNNTEHRESILKSSEPESRCFQFDTLKNMDAAELKKVFKGQKIVYVYHNQIDAKGDKLNTENEVFIACEEAIEEIFRLIKRLSANANTTHFIITADHGFIYKRDKITESDKIGNITDENIYKARRYIISKKKIRCDGIASLPLCDVLRNKDDKIVYFPVGSDIFKVTGGGMNFVHGGSSPQEILVPLIDVRVEKGHKDIVNAEISPIGTLDKITNLIVSLEFFQTKPVSNIVKEAKYRIYFVTDDEIISNEIIHLADSEDKESEKRIFKLKFRLKNRQYSRSEKYYLLVVNDKTRIEIERREIIIDIPFANDFGFQ